MECTKSAGCVFTGVIQAGFGAVPHQIGEGEPQGGVGPVEHATRLGKLLGQFPPHANGLGSLARKDESRFAWVEFHRSGRTTGPETKEPRQVETDLARKDSGLESSTERGSP